MTLLSEILEIRNGRLIIGDADFKEEEHPRVKSGQEAGQFTSSSGGEKADKSIKNSIEIVKGLITSGGDIGSLKISEEEKSFLKSTVEDKPYELYRGVHLMKFRMTPEQFSQAKQLKEGDSAPSFLSKKGNSYSSSTKSANVAKYYAKEGHIEIVLKTVVGKNNILVDTTNLKKILIENNKESLLPDEDYDYFKRDKEVILEEPIKYAVHSIKVNKK
uniref:Uncharacterized protein n=1 Tax=viral metagenome TaxID=1070528 RepID=A0A6M3LV42_9ZZZZ